MYISGETMIAAILHVMLSSFTIFFHKYLAVFANNSAEHC